MGRTDDNVLGRQKPLSTEEHVAAIEKLNTQLEPDVTAGSESEFKKPEPLDIVDDTLKPKVPDTRELEAHFEEEVSQLVESVRQLTGTDLGSETFTPEIKKTVTRLLDHVSNNILLDPM